jgi:membrane carboxypeptidase/penicillin-binding protein PbpC
VDIINAKLEVWSTLKPFIYLKYFEKYGFQNSVPNSKICIGSYCPNNWNKSFNDYVSLNTALNLSYNIPIMHIVRNKLGLKNVTQMFVDLGLYNEVKDPNDYSILLGTQNIRFFDLIKAYSIFLHNWALQDFDFVAKEKVESKQIYSNTEDIRKIKDILKNNGYFKDLSIKTGTTSDFKEQYIIGFNDKYVFWVWLWNKDWEKTSEGSYALEKGENLIKILKENILDK